MFWAYMIHTSETCFALALTIYEDLTNSLLSHCLARTVSSVVHVPVGRSSLPLPLTFSNSKPLPMALSHAIVITGAGLLPDWSFVGSVVAVSR